MLQQTTSEIRRTGGNIRGLWALLHVPEMGIYWRFSQGCSGAALLLNRLPPRPRPHR